MPNPNPMRIRLCICFLAWLPTAAMSQTNFDTVKIRPFKLTDNLYMLTGAGGNIALLTGSDGVLMVDDQYAPLSEKIREAVNALDPGGVKYIINTHLHGDHTGGNEYFRKLGVTLMAHENVRSRMMKELVTPQRTIPPRPREAWPVITVQTAMAVHLNGEDVEVVHLDPGHTDGDMMIFFKGANVMHTGDAFVRSGYPRIDGGNGGSFTGYISSLERLYAAANESTRVIPGHGKLAVKADIKAFRDKLADIRDQVAAALKKGTKIEDIPSLGITDKYEAELGKGFVKGKDFVLMAAEQLKAAEGKK